MYRFTLSDYQNLCTVAHSLRAGKITDETKRATIYDRCATRLAQLQLRELRISPDVPVRYDGLEMLLKEVSAATLPPLSFGW